LGGEHIGKKTQEQFIRELQEVNSNITVIGQYVNSHMPIMCKCNVCNYVFKPRPYNLLRGHGCPNCAGLKKKTHEDFVNQLGDINNHIKVLSKYVNDSIKVKCQCQTCGAIFENTPNHLLRGVGCTICAHKSIGVNKRKTHDDFVKELKEVNQDVELLTNYIRSSDKIMVRCRLCGKVYAIIANNLLRGNRCSCSRMSRGERKIQTYLESNNITYAFQHKFNDCRNSKPLPFDFYLPTLNICIEYDGRQHFLPSGFGSHDKQKIQNNFNAIIINDNIKDNYCVKNKIKLIRIPYTEFDNIERFLENEL